MSPAQSESFAPRDLVSPSPVPSVSSDLDSAGSQIGSSRVDHDRGETASADERCGPLYTEPSIPSALSRSTKTGGVLYNF